MKTIRQSQLKGSNSCYHKRTKIVPLSEGRTDRIEKLVFQKSVIKNWFRSKELRGREDEVLDAILLIQAGEQREDIPKDLLSVYDIVRSILKNDGRFDLRSGEFDEIKAFIVTQLACRRRYLDEMIPRAYKGFFFDTAKSAEVNAMAVKERILRYLDDEDRDLIVPDAMTLDLFGQDVEIKPDLLAVDHHAKAVEAIIIRTGKSDCSAKGRSIDRNLMNNKELYSLFRYARKIAESKGWSEEACKGSYYFLRKEADKPTQQYIEPGYFGSSNMKHVATLQVTGRNPLEAIDESYEKQFEEYMIGTECSGDDCKNCERFELCYFAEAPLKTEVERHEKALSDISLSPAQEEVVMHRRGVMRTNAGAGSGKTTVVALNTAFMVAEGIDPASILLITFSNAGAREMKDRTRSYLKGLGMNIDVDNIRIVTFNEFGQDVLNKEYEKLGFTLPQRPIDDTERSAIIAKLLNRTPVSGLYYPDINLKIKGFRGARLIAEEAFHAIKRDRLSIYDEQKLKDALEERDASIKDEKAFKELLELYDEYDEQLRSSNLIEFQDQESMLFEILDMDPYYFDKMGYKHIIIDEFQDTSRNQMEIIKTLLDVADFESLLVVGDDSQAIYGWRDADSSNIIDFEERIGTEVKDVNLVENHRSTPEILEFANGINALNKNRVEKDLVATRPSGAPVTIKGFHKVDREYDYITKIVKDKIEEGHAPEDIAILTRTKSEIVKIAGKLAEAGIESCLQAPQKMLENSRVQGILSLAKAYRDTTATKHVLVFMNCSMCGGKVLELSEEEIADIIEDGQKIVRDMKALFGPQKVTAFRNLVDEIAAEDDIAIALADRLDRFPTVEMMIDYLDSFERFGGEELKREGLYSGVVLSTAHSSKGLEWPVIINSITHYDKKDGMGFDEREEQRRLLFVSSTRARDELYITGQIKLSGTAEEGFTVNRFLDEAATIANQPLDLLDEEGKAERTEKRAERMEQIRLEQLLKEETKTNNKNNKKAAV